MELCSRSEILMKMQTWKTLQGHDRLLFNLFPHLQIPTRFWNCLKRRLRNCQQSQSFRPHSLTWRVQAFAWLKWPISLCWILWIVSIFTGEFRQDQTYFKSLDDVQLLNTIIFHLGRAEEGQRKCVKCCVKNVTLLSRLQSCCFGESLFKFFFSLFA